MPKYYVFRINYEESWQPLVRSAIDKGELRQGWGMQQGTDSLRVEQDESAFLKAWDKIWPGSEISYCKRKYSSLSKMLDFNNGDIIVVPKASDWRQFLILTVNGSYRFDDDLNSKFNNSDDFRHIIPVGNTCRTGNVKEGSAGIKRNQHSFPCEAWQRRKLDDRCAFEDLRSIELQYQ